MADHPHASVLVFAYNQEKLIGDTLKHIVAQRVDFPFEIVVGEDCSQDSTRAVVSAWQHRYPHLIRMITADRNVGLTENCRRCEATARGKHLAYCGGDDLWTDPLKLARQVEILEACPEVQLVHTGITLLRDGKSVAVPTCGQMEGALYEQLLVSDCIVASTVCVRGSVIRDYHRGPFISRSYLMEDYPRWLYASRLGRIAYLPEPMVSYRVLAGSITHGSPQKLILFTESERQVFRDFADIYGCSDSVRLAAEKEYNQRLLNRSLLARDGACLKRELPWMLKHNPEWIALGRRRFEVWLVVNGLTHLYGLYLWGRRLRWRLAARRERSTVLNSETANSNSNSKRYAPHGKVASQSLP